MDHDKIKSTLEKLTDNHTIGKEAVPILTDILREFGYFPPVDVRPTPAAGEVWVRTHNDGTDAYYLIVEHDTQEELPGLAYRLFYPTDRDVTPAANSFYARYWETEKWKRVMTA